MREEVAKHEGGDAVAAVLLQHAQRQDVRDLGAVTATQLKSVLPELRHGNRWDVRIDELGEKYTEYRLYGTLEF